MNAPPGVVDPDTLVPRRAWTRPPQRWSVLVGVLIAVIVLGSVVTDLLHHANAPGRLSDLHRYYTAEETDLASCSGGLHDSLVALEAILNHSSRDRATAESVAAAGAQACSPALNETLYGMETTAPPRSLAGTAAAKAGSDLNAWAYPDASTAQADIGRLLRGPSARAGTLERQLDRELVSLKSFGERIQRLFATTAARLHGRLRPFRPSIVLAPPAGLDPRRGPA
ncbi:hypothetical protein [Conexibacter sp. DBS9H8]|uniref:hypothetical protein n=1 Tax=Conexibacter sp. DBS9H8 TaxID=2937801 RepID=UPI00200DAAF1|nr:hypothetical protein [Conexibacter sp. DBS9H8]